MPTLTIDGREITVDRGTPVIEAAAQLGIDVPHFCYHPGLSAPANCRMCLVEVEDAPKLSPACYTQCTDEMVVHTQNERVRRARKAVLEFILLNHPVDCPICDQAGECKLQDLYFEYSAQASRLKTNKVNKVKVFPIGPNVVYDGERCILCTRCVRFCDEITKTSELTTVQRADMTEIRTFPGMDLDNDYSECTVDLCPVGALTSREFRFKCRVWYLSTTSSICTGCARGCNIHLEHFKDEVQRYRPRPNPEVNEWWMCDHGRRTGPALHDDRLLTPVVDGDGSVPANAGLAAALQQLETYSETHDASSLGLVLSPQLSCEELMAAFEFAERYGITRLYTNGHPDDAFTLRREPDEVADDFLICADKNPNLTGLLRLAESRGVTVHEAEDLLMELGASDSPLRGLIVLNAEFPYDGSGKQRLVAGMRDLDLVLYLGRTAMPFSTFADVALPACSHAEQAGSFVNVDGLHQRFEKAFEPHGHSRPVHAWLRRLARRLRLSWPWRDFDALETATREALAAPAPEEEDTTVDEGGASDASGARA